MDYIPTAINKVVKGTNSNGMPRWRNLSLHDIKVLLSAKTSNELLEKYFPGYGFYGPLIGKANPDDMRNALEVLKATLELHAMLNGCDALVEMDHKNHNRPILHRVKNVENNAIKHLAKINSALTEYKHFTISLGSGYDNKLNNENSIPQCHILRVEIPLQPMYSKWLSQRVAIYNMVANTMRSSSTFYLHLHNQIQLVENSNGSKLRIDIFGTQILSEEWNKWLDEYELTVKENIEVSALEQIAGLRNLADVLASIHISSAIPTVDKGMFGRFGAEDSLTDLWLRFYDSGSNPDYSIGACEVCGRLFIGTHRGKRGHDACMNRQRVIRSRTRKFAKLIESGTNQQEASKIAGISVTLALKTMTEKGFKEN